MRLFLFCITLVVFVNTSAQNADIRLLREINLHRNQSLDKSFKFITNSITPVLIGAPIILYTIGQLRSLPETNEKTIALIGAIGCAGVSTFAIKYMVKRERPFNTYSDIERLTDGSSYSFPSGHTSSTFALATSLSLAYPKWYIIAPSFAYAGLVAYSRMDLGVHYPSDVLAGALLGVGSAYLSRYITYKLYPKIFKPNSTNNVLQN